MTLPPVPLLPSGSRDFVRAGFNLYDLYFADGSAPPDLIAYQ